MKNLKLQGYISLIRKANVIVLYDEGEYRFVTFNHFVNPDDLKVQIEKKYLAAFYEHIESLVLLNDNSHNYLKSLEIELNKLLLEFKEQKGIHFYNNLTINDNLNNCISYEALSEKLKTTISSFLNLQNSSLKSFLTSTCHSGINSNFIEYRWKGKKIELVELGNSLLECGVIESVNGPLCKKDFIINLSHFFNIEIDNPHKMINKAMNRDNPSLFIDRLKLTIEKFYEKIINKLK